MTLAQRYQNDALRIAVAGGSRGHADIEYRAVRIMPREVEHAVVNLLRFYEPPSALVFANTRETVRHLQSALLERGFSTVSLSGELSQNERNHALQALRDGRARVCVATDVAARGIDLPGLALVVHADLPNDAETLQHRSRPHRPRRPQGRQRPAGAAGAAPPRRGPARHGQGRGRLGRAPHAPTRSASSTRTAWRRTRSWPRSPARTTSPWRGRCWSSARPRRSRRLWCGSTAPACRPPRT